MITDHELEELERETIYKQPTLVTVSGETFLEHINHDANDIEEVIVKSDEDTTDYINRIKSMFYMQARLNLETNGETWLDGYTRERRVIDWMACFKGEIFEALDCYPWKHWANINKPVDIDNLRMEIVDSIHFAMSFLMETYYKSLVINELNSTTNTLSIPDDHMFISKMSYEEKINTIINSLVTRETLNSLSIDVERQLEVFKEDVKGDNDRFISLLKLLSQFSIDNDVLVVRFISLLKLLGDVYPNFKFDTIYDLYVGKYVLNGFRQENGYKDGRYIKQWGNVEDNAFLVDYILNNKNYTIDNIKEVLKTEYKKYI